MIEIICDKCERTFEVGPEMASKKANCPFCDDVNRVPAQADPQPPAASPPDAQESQLPSRSPDTPKAHDPAPAPSKAKTDSKDGDEYQICIVRPGMFRARPFRYLFIILLVVGGIALAIFAKTSDAQSKWTWAFWPGLVIFAGALLWFGIWWISAHFWVKLIITNKRSIRQEGIIKRHTTEVLHDHIRSVDIRQSLLHRLLRIGDLDIDSAGQGGETGDIEIQMTNVPRPYEVKKIIDQYRKM